MEHAFTLPSLTLLLAAGLSAGFINTLAGGGSFLTLPALMLLGMPADVANGTNRVGVLIQSVAGMRGFDRHGALDRGNVLSVLLPTVPGAVAGALVASWMPPAALKPVLLGTMMSMALVTALWPAVVAPPPGTAARRLAEAPVAALWLFAAGFYGGFLQAGVGFVLLAALGGVLRYDLLRANALKMASTALFSVLALTVFTWQDQVLWVPGLILAAGQVVGARLSVGFALRVSPEALRYFLLVTVLAVSVAAWLA